jgi:hypothetical protein
LCVSSEIHYFITYYSKISFATDKKDFGKNCNAFLLKNYFFSMKVCYGEQIEKNVFYSAIL